MPKTPAIRDLPPRLRPRERLGSLGPEGLREEELLALVLRTGGRGKDALELARSLLRGHPGGELLDLGFRALAAKKGVGPTRAASLLAAAELARRWDGRTEEGPPALDSPRRAAEAFEGMRGLKKERFEAVYLNARRQVLARETVSIGTVSASLVHPREVFAPALECRASGVLVAHNHPSGDPHPSDEDREVTRRLEQAGRLLGVELVDHLVLGGARTYSFREGGELRRDSIRRTA